MDAGFASLLFGDTVTREVMVPRPDIIAIEAGKTLRDVQALVLQHGYSRIPVFKETLDEVSGVVYAKDVLKALHQGLVDTPLPEIAREAHWVPESKKVAEVLRQMQQDKVHIALVYDEYGSLSGLLTLEDLIEELVGEIADEYDTEEPEVEPVVEGSSYRVSGRLSIDDLDEIVGTELPQEEWDTVGGLMIAMVGDVPTEGQELTFQGLHFVAERVQGRRIARIVVTIVDEPGVPNGDEDDTSS